MDKCVNHPETETPFECLKYNVCLCVECLSCRDPEIYFFNVVVELGP